MRVSLLTAVVLYATFVGSTFAVSFDAAVALGDSLSRNPGGERSPLLSQLVSHQLGAPLTSYATNGSSSTELLTNGQHTQAAANFGSDNLVS